MLIRLTEIIESSIETIHFPWTGMSIVFSTDERDWRVNYYDQEIILDPTDVPEQWLQVLQYINVNEIEKAVGVVKSIESDKSMFEMYANLKFESSAALLCKDKNDAQPMQFKVVVRPGFTCSVSNFYYFLRNMNDGFTKVHRDMYSNRSVVANEDLLAPKTSPVESNTSCEQQVQMRPVELPIIVEFAHGTKLLDNGNFRVDVRDCFADVNSLLESEMGRLVQLAVRHAALAGQLDQARSSLVASLSLKQVTKGVGVSDEQYLVCLLRLAGYAEQRQGVGNSHGYAYGHDYGYSGSRARARNKAALSHLSGLRVVVGHYLGMADDGSIILPWDIYLPDDC
jgi:hypothetical protein